MSGEPAQSMRTHKETATTELRAANIGCGMSPTPGWANVDNSWSITLASHPWLVKAMKTTRILRQPQLAFINFAQENNIIHADIRKGLPFDDDSLDIVYSSHMLEHLDQASASAFLTNTHKILKPGGYLRLAVPDLEMIITEYLDARDADRFVERLFITQSEARSFRQRILNGLVPFRGHRWMYDASSLRHLLLQHGFVNVIALPAGETSIPVVGSLDLHERDNESLYVEAQKPTERNSGHG